ncbi:MAG: NUDIX hydrolase [Microgenomates group bacterium Gr01-1014_16]|nr:MAG: NUDIX hydrolase [Microgenomates group bacterium Gr01-1014_16]
MFKGSKVLLRRPKANPEYRGNLGWGFPKGWVDEGEKLEEAAVREVREEGGVEAKIIKKLPTIKVFFKDKGETVMKFITYFVMEWEKDVPEGYDFETEEVKWVTKDEALTMLAFKNEKELLAGC